MTQYHAVKLFEEKKVRSSWDAERETWKSNRYKL